MKIFSFVFEGSVIITDSDKETSPEEMEDTLKQVIQDGIGGVVEIEVTGYCERKEDEQ